ncbi:MAG TPA: tetratricopeptide repeat protein, partial [Kofleriaceae bacterium]|nr:tetratricopeptide repeat protein [Kofleriaceae bacterium]
SAYTPALGSESNFSSTSLGAGATAEPFSIGAVVGSFAVVAGVLELFALGKFDEALEEYQEAFDAKPLPGFLYNIGQCYRNLGDYDQAIFSFKKYLKLEPDADNKDAVEQLITDLEDKKARGDGAKFVRKKPRPPEEDKPIYSKWWFWTGVGVVTVAGGVGIYSATRPDGPPTTNLGNIVFGK